MPKKNIKTLIVAAYSRELAPYCKLGKRSFVIKDSVACLAAGIGPVAAASGLASFLKDHKPSLIVSVNTAGIINTKDFKIGQIVCVRSASFISGRKDVFAASGFGADVGAIKFRSHPIFKKLPKVSVFCPQEISQTNQFCRHLSSAGFDVENLEVYAFAHVAKMFKIPIFSVLGLTNVVCPGGHEEWREHEGKVCEEVAKEVEKIINPKFQFPNKP